MKVIVTGSRGWTDADKIRRRLALLPHGAVVVHGQSRGGGADTIADKIARELGYTVIPVPVNAQDRARARTPRQAPILRNIRMFDEHPDANHVEAFWDGESPGTRHAMNEASRRGVPVVLSETR